MAEHRRVAREAFGAFGGVEVDTQGDAFFCAFPTAPGALAAATMLTEALGTGPIRLRVGVHTGTPLQSLLRLSNERYWMLETIREYAIELLQESDEYEPLRDRHLSFCLALAEEAEPRLTGPDQRQWFERLALEQDNVREALDYACDSGDGERASCSQERAGSS